MIIVNEIYGPVSQGEGKSAGKSVVFIRLSGCNLACQWCDTPYTWNWIGTPFLHPQKFDVRKESHKMTALEVVNKVIEVSPETKAVVISGGEPFLQQRELAELVRLLRFRGYWIEVETNGTQIPAPEFLYYIDQVNCSPKLENSGVDNPLAKRIIPNALFCLADNPKVTFKFVVTSGQDLFQILDLLDRFNIRADRVWLMPEGRTREEQLARQDQVRALCQSRGFNFSPRLHVLEHGDVRAV